MSLPRAYLFPTLTILTSPNDLFAVPIPSIFEITLQATKTKNWWMVSSIFDAMDDCYHHNIFTVPGKFITVKGIILLIGFCIFAPECIKSSM